MAKNKKQMKAVVEDPPSYDEKVETSEEEQSGDDKLKTPSSKSETEKQVSTVKTKKKKKKKKVRVSGEAQPSTALALTKKNKKRCIAETSTEEKPNFFQRVFTEEDDIRVLQGIIDFESEMGKPHTEAKNGVYEFVKGSISFLVSSGQFFEKIRTLRRKFLGKVKKKGLEPVFANAHDKDTFALSMRIWGRDVESAALEDIEVFLIANLGLDEEFTKKGWNFVPKKKKRKLEQKWRDLVRETTSAIAQATTQFLP